MISLQQQVNSVKNAKNLSATPSGNTCSRKVHQYTVTTHTSISRNAQQLKLRGQTGDIGLGLLISASRPKFSPWPQPREYGLGFRCSASDSSIWPRLTLLVHCEISTQGATTYCYSTRHNWQAGIPVRVYTQEKQKIPQKHVTFQRGQKLQCNTVTTQSSLQLKFFSVTSLTVLLTKTTTMQLLLQSGSPFMTGNDSQKDHTICGWEPLSLVRDCWALVFHMPHFFWHRLEKTGIRLWTWQHSNMLEYLKVYATKRERVWVIISGN